MTVNPIALTIRAKKLGVLIRDARLASEKSISECAQALGIGEADFEEFEYGGKSPSLPELETLAYYLDIPLDHFWGDQTLSEKDGRKIEQKMRLAIPLRQRMIGALLRQARLEKHLTLEALAERAYSSPTLLESFEMGEMAVPLPDLEVLCGILDRSIKEFMDRAGPIGAWATQQRAIQDFMTLSPELQVFVSKPINRPYLELAQRLSEMSVDKLRGVAEGLLEITL